MPALVETAALPDDPGHVAYQITGLSHEEVANAISGLLLGESGEAWFRPIRREYSIQDGVKRWRSRGFVRLTPTAEACADVRAWQRSRAGA